MIPSLSPERSEGELESLIHESIAANKFALHWKPSLRQHDQYKFVSRIPQINISLSYWRFSILTNMFIILTNLD
jgi:hypothetical protein